MVQQDVLHKLQQEGWHLKLEALEALENDLQQGDADDCSSSNMPSVSQLSYSTLRTALLNCDYRKFGAGCLPDDVNRASSSVLKGPYVLQVMSATDISKPSYATSSSNRLLLLKLTDGRISCKAMEHKQCNQLNDTLLPGTKVVLDQATIKLGVIQLDLKSLRVLGGRVDNLAEAFEAQRKYGGINRPGLGDATGSAAGAGVGPAVPGEAAGARLTSGAAVSAAVAADDGAAAPRFKMFVVGRDDSRRAAGSSSSRSRGTAAAGAAKPGAASVGTSAAIAAAAVGAATKQQETQEVKRSVDVAPVRLIDAQTVRQQSAAQAKLLDKLERSQTEVSGGRGRGRGLFRGRRGRRGKQDSDDDNAGGAMTLEEYEARQTGGKVTLSTASTTGKDSAADEQMRRDEEMARQLQAQLDLEEAGLQQQHQQRQQAYASQQQQYGNRRGAGGGTSRRSGGPVHIQYEQQRHRGQPADGADHTDMMLDNFNYDARPGSGQPSMGRGRGSGSTGRRQWSEGRGRGGGDNRGRGHQHGGGGRGSRGRSGG